ncbi:hypothetical protein [Fibrivirga algicola]|uniref:DUF1574 domain-containing protein n=1 Tax=Fibrivirga algicola TaxID=2950420 RepID=A0ABX0QCV2_9BACT|nr:hypothetical protein [Fibrivirga algicola]NID08917.1 hypothetical protein [Fibrivirga algicola]
MIQFFVKLGLLVSCLAITLFALYTKAVQQDTTSYFAAMVDKHQRLDALAGKPRLILAGGSGVAFGIDSQLLEDSLGIPVVNMGLHADLGLPFMLKQLQAIAKPTDIVLFTPEYFLTYGDDYTQFYVGDFYKPALDFMTFDGPFDYAVRRIKYYLYRIRTNFFLSPDTNAHPRIDDTTSVYFRGAFSARGDLLSPLNNKRSTELGKLFLPDRAYTTEIGLMSTMVAALQQRGTTLLVLYPAFSESQFAVNKEVIAHYVAKLNQVKHIKLIGSPERHQYPDSCFFDTPYHLTGPCRREYTMRILHDFKATRN